MTGELIVRLKGQAVCQFVGETKRKTTAKGRGSEKNRGNVTHLLRDATMVIYPTGSHIRLYHAQ